MYYKLCEQQRKLSRLTHWAWQVCVWSATQQTTV